MSKPALALTGNGYTIAIAPEAIQAKAALLNSSVAITTVTDPASNAQALDSIKELTQFLSALEKCRKEVKAPLLDLGRDVDNRAANFASDIENEKRRLMGLCSEHATTQARLKREADERAAQAEREARQREAEQMRKDQEAERARLDAELAKQRAELAAEEAKNKKQRDAARLQQEEADRKQREADELQRQQQEAKRLQEEADAKQASEALAAMRTTGTVKGVKPTLDYEVEDVAALYAAHPHLCEITVKRRETLAFVKQSQDMGGEAATIKIPGLRIIEKFTVQTR